MTEPMETHLLDDVAERAERGRVFSEMFPGSGVSERWLADFEHLDRPTDERSGPVAKTETPPPAREQR